MVCSLMIPSTVNANFPAVNWRTRNVGTDAVAAQLQKRRFTHAYMGMLVLSLHPDETMMLLRNCNEL